MNLPESPQTFYQHFDSIRQMLMTRYITCPLGYAYVTFFFNLIQIDFFVSEKNDFLFLFF